MSAAASSLMLGVALVGATALIVLSSDARFAEAGEEVMRADHAIAATTMTSVGQAPLPREVADRAAAVPGVSRAVALTATEAKLVSPRPRSAGGGEAAAQIRSIVRWEAATVVLLGGLLGIGTAVGTVFLMHVATGSSFLRPDPPWWLFAVIAAGAAVVTLATSALPARRAASVPILEAAKAE